MLAKRIIPCLDVKDGRVVKGTNFVNLRDAGDPVELAKLYEDQGADELVFLDITASSDKRYILRDLVARVADQLFIPFTVGGGIGDIETIRDMLAAGADKVSINTAAVRQPDFLKEASDHFGAQCIVLAIDARRITAKNDLVFPVNGVRTDEHSRFEVYTHGGRNPTGIDAVKWAVYAQSLGVGEILLTSMDKDGTKSGYDLEVTAEISRAVTIPVIASGGAGTKAHITDALKICDAALLASLLHYRELTIEEIKTACRRENILVR